MATRTGQVPLPLPPLSLSEQLQRWVELEGQKVCVRTGRPLSTATL